MAERNSETGRQDPAGGGVARERLLLRLQPLRRMSAAARYVCATAFIVLAFAARLVVPGEFAAFPFTFLIFLPAVVLAALLFGRGTGFYATILSALLATDFLRTAFSELRVTVALVGFVGVGAFISTVLEALSITVERLAESEQRFRRFLENAPQPMWLLRPDGTIEYLNAAFRSYAGFTAMPSLEGWIEAVHPDDHEEFLALRRRALRDGVAWHCEVRLRRAAEDAWRWHAADVKPLHRDDGSIFAWVGSSIDIHELRRLNQELEARVAERSAELRKSEDALAEARKMEAIGRSAGTIAHDYNNILQAVIGNLILIDRRTGQDPRLKKLVENALAGAERGERLAQELLAFARRQKLEPEPIEVNAAITDLRELLVRTLPAEIELRTEFAKGLPPAMADLGQLERALLNLVLNGRDAMLPEGGVLTILTGLGTPADLRGEFVQIAVRDTGHGMLPEVRERAFEPFFSTKPRGSGTGLGLSQVYGFARQSGGTVALDTVPGDGTTIRLFLPVAAPSPAAATAIPETVGEPRRA